MFQNRLIICYFGSFNLVEENFKNLYLCFKIAWFSAVLDNTFTILPNTANSKMVLKPKTEKRSLPEELKNLIWIFNRKTALFKTEKTNLDIKVKPKNDMN